MSSVWWSDYIQSFCPVFVDQQRVFVVDVVSFGVRLGILIGRVVLCITTSLRYINLFILVYVSYVALRYIKDWDFKSGVSVTS